MLPVSILSNYGLITSLLYNIILIPSSVPYNLHSREHTFLRDITLQTSTHFFLLIVAIYNLLNLLTFSMIFLFVNNVNEAHYFTGNMEFGVTGLCDPGGEFPLQTILQLEICSIHPNRIVSAASTQISVIPVYVNGTIGENPAKNLLHVNSP